MGNAGLGYGWGILGMTHMVLWWILLVLGIVVLAKWLFSGSSGDGRGPRGRALAILEERYARGEINKDELEAKRRDLNG